MRIRFRTLFVLTTIVAIIAFTFTLGREEGLFTLLFFASIFGTSKKKERWINGGLLVIILVGLGVFTRYSTRTYCRGLTYGAPDDVLFITAAFPEATECLVYA